MDELSILVNFKHGEDGRSYFNIKFPPNQGMLGVETSIMILAGGISLLIKAGHEQGHIKDFEMLEKIVEYLQSEFVSNDSFKDAILIKNKI